MWTRDPASIGERSFCWDPKPCTTPVTSAPAHLGQLTDFPPHQIAGQGIAAGRINAQHHSCHILQKGNAKLKWYSRLAVHGGMTSNSRSRLRQGCGGPCVPGGHATRTNFVCENCSSKETATQPTLFFLMPRSWRIMSPLVIALPVPPSVAVIAPALVCMFASSASIMQHNKNCGCTEDVDPAHCAHLQP